MLGRLGEAGAVDKVRAVEQYIQEIPEVQPVTKVLRRLNTYDSKTLVQGVVRGLWASGIGAGECRV